MAIIKLTDDNFDETVLKSDLPVLVDFYADWCVPCKRIAPILEEISDEKDGEILVCKVNVDENQSLAVTYQVMSLPNVISFKNGAINKRVVGVVAKESLLDLIN